MRSGEKVQITVSVSLALTLFACTLLSVLSLPFPRGGVLDISPTRYAIRRLQVRRVAVGIKPEEEHDEHRTVFGEVSVVRRWVLCSLLCCIPYFASPVSLGIDNVRYKTLKCDRRF